jgi:hypothetical protein
MFKRKHRALLFSCEAAPFPEMILVTYTVEGPRRLRLADCRGAIVLLKDNGSVTGSRLFDRWEQL